MALERFHNRAVISCANVWLDQPGIFAPRRIFVEGGRIASIRPMDDNAGEVFGPVHDFGEAFPMLGLINTHVPP